MVKLENHHDVLAIAALRQGIEEYLHASGMATMNFQLKNALCKKFAQGVLSGTIASSLIGYLASRGQDRQQSEDQFRADFLPSL